MRSLQAGLFLLLLIGASCLAAMPLRPDQVALVVNDVDPQSLVVAKYYQKIRGIPEENLIYVSFHGAGSDLPEAEFTRVREIIVANTLHRIRAYAITWTEPYRVGCMSLTSALSLGVDQRLCAADCSSTLVSPFYRAIPAEDGERNASSIIPSMMLAGETEREVKKLIDRGFAADGRFPRGNAYLLSTRDKKRNVRTEAYKQSFQAYESSYNALHVRQTEFVTGQSDVMFYFTGSAVVPYLGSNQFLPGAVADHLTSAGGMLTDSYQMSVLRWLEAGATASYGTVVEPCNHVQKFPDPVQLIRAIEAGESLITAYWSSVKMPGQGVFVGEPMAAPYAVQPLQKTVVR